MKPAYGAIQKKSKEKTGCYFTPEILVLDKICAFWGNFGGAKCKFGPQLAFHCVEGHQKLVQAPPESFDSPPGVLQISPEYKPGVLYICGVIEVAIWTPGWGTFIWARGSLHGGGGATPGNCHDKLSSAGDPLSFMVVSLTGTWVWILGGGPLSTFLKPTHLSNFMQVFYG